MSASLLPATLAALPSTGKTVRVWECYGIDRQGDSMPLPV